LELRRKAYNIGIRYACIYVRMYVCIHAFIPSFIRLRHKVEIKGTKSAYNKRLFKTLEYTSKRISTHSFKDLA